MSGSTMRVAIFSEVYWPMVSGVSRALERLVLELRAHGHEARVYSATYPLPPGAPDRQEVHRSPSTSLFLSPEVQWAFPRRREVLADLAGFTPDVVHLATEFAMGLTGLRCARALSLPVVASSHTDYERYAGRYGMEWALRPGWSYLRWFYSHATQVLCPSRGYEAHLHARGIQHTGTWTRGVDADVFHPGHRSEAFRARLGAGPDDVLVAYVGRMGPEKGISVLLDAWALLEDVRLSARLVFVGSGLMAPEVARRGFRDVRVTGMLSGPELSAAYASADVLVFPSTTETFGNVLLEAMASGLACIAAAAGGPLELARHGIDALFFPPDDAGGLAAALRGLLADGDLRARLGREARRTAVARSWSAACAPLFAEYRRAIEGRSGRQAA
jgi:phosphatidylinositol alpha 1,6-mannosyltransferase